MSVAVPYCRVTPETADAFRQEIPPESQVSSMGELFRVLGNPTRLRILSALLNEPLCVSCLTAVIQMDQSAVSQQLKVLRHNRLVSVRREGKLSIYSLADDHVRHLLNTALDHVREMYP